MKYRITLTEDQLKMIARGMEFYSRMESGQFHEIEKLGTVHDYRNETGRGHDSDMIRRMVEELKWELLGLKAGESYSVGKSEGITKDAQRDINLSYSIYREILHYLTVKNGVRNVYTSETLNYTNQPLIKIEEQKTVDIFE